jgi:hypothetical protein
MSQLVLSVLIWAFSLWLVADSIRRRKSSLWVIVIVLLQPYGGLAYLLYIKLSSTRRGRELLGRFAPRLSTPEEAASSRLGEPALEVADRLELQRRFGEAILIYRRVVDQQKDNPRALHGLARCLVEVEQPIEALEKYEALMAVDPRYRSYAAALEYAEALHRAERHADAIDLLEGLVQETGRLNHRLALAHYCEAAGQTARARSVLSDALAAYECSPEPEREANRHWHRRIADKLEELAHG